MEGNDYIWEETVAFASKMTDEFYRQNGKNIETVRNELWFITMEELRDKILKQLDDSFNLI